MFGIWAVFWMTVNNFISIPTDKLENNLKNGRQETILKHFNGTTQRFYSCNLASEKCSTYRPCFSKISNWEITLNHHTLVSTLK